jgi:hypothetical protein
VERGGGCGGLARRRWLELGSELERLACDGRQFRGLVMDHSLAGRRVSRDISIPRRLSHPKRMIATAENNAVFESERVGAIEKELKSKIANLEERLKSRITVRCGKDVEGCVVKDHRGIWYRARLDMTGANVSGVEATITGIWENGAKVNLYGENLDVSMCEKEAKGQTVTMREAGRNTSTFFLWLTRPTSPQS